MGFAVLLARPYEGGNEEELKPCRLSIGIAILSETAIHRFDISIREYS